MPKVSVAILAGGQSKRMGQDKALLEVGGKSVIEWVIAQVAPLTDDLFISCNNPEPFATLGWPIVPDIYPNMAALGGLYTALQTARHEAVLVVACDMPLLNPTLLQYLIELTPTADIIAPIITPPYPETLHTIYHKTCLAPIKSRLDAQRLQLSGFFDEVTVRYVSPAEIAPFDPHYDSFVNMNTPAEWHYVKQKMESAKTPIVKPNLSVLRGF